MWLNVAAHALLKFVKQEHKMPWQRRKAALSFRSLAASNPAMEFVMIRLILFAWFALAAILLVATDLSEDHHLKQITSTYFAQNDSYGAEYQARHTIRHHS